MPYTYVTGLVLLYRGDALAPRVVNIGTTTEVTRMRIFSIKAGFPTVADTGDVKLAPGAGTTISSTFTDPDECWVQIEVSTETMIPTCYLGHAASPKPATETIFKPGDFAAFDPTGKRLW